MSSYDEVPYSSYPYAYTHPRHLASMGALFGMKPADVERCRVLELGCAAGGNLIPLAVDLPEASFVGIDLSQRQIDEGGELIAALDLQNIALERADILTWNNDGPPFDYIICHGVFSWVPRPVQDRILQICREYLAPQGIAYISYNTYPGWHMRGMVREMMNFHAQRFEAPMTRVAQSRALLDFLIQAASSEGGTYAALLQNEMQIVRSCEDAYLYHEHLEDVNDPLYFYQFIERASEARLRFLCETYFSDMMASNFRDSVAETLARIAPDIVHLEQYMDFLRNRMFRRTLLCRHEVELTRELGFEEIERFHVAAALAPGEGDHVFSSRGPAKFLHENGGNIEVTHPIQKAALWQLHRAWPQAIAFHDLFAQALLQEAPKTMTEEDRKERLSLLGSLVLELFAAGMMELRLFPDRFAAKPTTKPQATRLARWQAGLNQPVTTLRHDTIRLSDLERQLVGLLDGARGIDDLTDELLARMQEGALAAPADESSPENQPPVALSPTREMVQTAVEQALERLSRQGVLCK